MLIEEIIGNKEDLDISHLKIETVPIKWYEASKRIQRRKTDQGTEVAFRFFRPDQRLRDGDVVYKDDEKAVVVEILPCDAIQVAPANTYEMGVACYEIGNKHLPISIQDDVLLIPYEEPIFRWLTAMGFRTEKVHAKLLNILNSTVQPHNHSIEAGPTIFSRIMGLASK